MSGSKRLVVNLSEVLYNEFDKALKEDSKKKSQFIREAIILYIEKKKREDILNQMKNGYIEMAEINSELSEEGFSCDMKDLNEYEAKLSESDFLNDYDRETRRYILC